MPTAGVRNHKLAQAMLRVVGWRQHLQDGLSGRSCIALEEDCVLIGMRVRVVKRADTERHLGLSLSGPVPGSVPTQCP